MIYLAHHQDFQLVCVLALLYVSSSAFGPPSKLQLVTRYCQFVLARLRSLSISRVRPAEKLGDSEPRYGQSEFFALHDGQQGLLVIGEVRRHKHQRGGPRQCIAHTLFPQKLPMPVGSNDIRCRLVHRSQSYFERAGRGTIL